MMERQPGFYRVKLHGRWRVIEWVDPNERAGGWQYGSHLDPQPWDDSDFDEIGDRVRFPEEEQ